MVKHINITVTGKVHGVGFRYSVLDKALELKLNGLVRNQGNNQVYVEAEGEVENLKELLRFCKTGPQGANVKDMQYEEAEMQNYTEFGYEGNFYNDKPNSSHGHGHSH